VIGTVDEFVDAEAARRSAKCLMGILHLKRFGRNSPPFGDLQAKLRLVGASPVSP